MNKVYLRAEDNEAGVQVNAWPEKGPNEMVHVHVGGRLLCMLEDPVPSAVLLGLSLRAESKGDWSHVEAGLRRMLTVGGLLPGHRAAIEKLLEWQAVENER